MPTLHVRRDGACIERGLEAAVLDPGLARIVRALPDYLPLPEFTPEPDGSISLDWIMSRSRVFSLSAGRNSRLAYAWLDGSDKGQGVAYFDGEVVPPMVLLAIRMTVNQGNNIGDAAVRLA